MKQPTNKAPCDGYTDIYTDVSGLPNLGFDRELLRFWTGVTESFGFEFNFFQMLGFSLPFLR
jgi:hypothetical protein